MISREEVLHLAELARLKVGEAEIAPLQKDISSILDYVGQVAAVEGAGKKEAGEHRNVMREDVPYKEGAALSGKREALLKAFPVSESRYNVVRKIIQKDE
jgi:aspartyl-tRNA(Asn)/glutamyl-tRNA(Gln) amidotransferase subunit C